MTTFFDREIITSRQNASVVGAGKLSDKKYRDAEKRFRIDGIKLFEEAVASKTDIETVFIRVGSIEKIKERLAPYLEAFSGTDVKMLSDGVFDKLSEERSPEGIICVVKHIDKLHKIVKVNDKAKFDISAVIDPTSKIFAVESVRDPGNLGTIIRTAAAFDIDTLILSADCADIYNPKTLRAAMGAVFRQNTVRVDDLGKTLRALSAAGRTTYAATLGKSAVLLGETVTTAADCIVVGNEGHGLSDETVKSCDRNILIPMVAGAESLNAAVAASVFMWEQFGRRLVNK